MKFQPDKSEIERTEVVSARLPKEWAREFFTLCKQHDMRPGTMARQMIEHCIREMLLDHDRKTDL